MSPLKICENVGSSFAGKGNAVLLTLAEKTSLRRRKILSKSRTNSFAILLITARVKTTGVKTTKVKTTVVKTTGSQNKDFQLDCLF